MGQYFLSADTSFSAAHTLPGVDMCERMHGHNWRVRLTIQFKEDGLDKVGMGVDFRLVEKVIRDAVADFEHRYLNELEPFRQRAPTAEHIAQLVASRATAGLRAVAPAATVAEVELWETPDYRLVFRP